MNAAVLFFSSKDQLSSPTSSLATCCDRCRLMGGGQGMHTLCAHPKSLRN